MTKMSDPTVESRGNIVQVRDVAEGFLALTLTGEVAEGGKGDFSDYYVGAQDADGMTRVVGVKEDSLNYTVLHKLADGDWDNLKGKAIKLSGKPVRTGAYAGKIAICIDAA